jgi:MarR family transcriptional regulator, organic hydroperoxide resistance regulator
MDAVFGKQWESSKIQAMEALQAWALAFAELNQLMSSWLHLPTTDANALGQVLWADASGDPLSPSRLGQRIGMSSGSVTVLLNRLEEAGLLERSREHTDRRRVTLRPTAAARERARAFAETSTAEISAALDEVSAAELERVTIIVHRMVSAAMDAAGRLRR